MYYIAGIFIIGVMINVLTFIFKNLFFNEDGFIWGIINTVCLFYSFTGFLMELFTVFNI